VGSALPLARRTVFLLALSVWLCAAGFAQQPDAPAQELQQLAREAESSSAGYAKLAAFAARHADHVWGARAALVLALRDYAKGRYRPARSWFQRAERDPLLREYALHWGALAARASGAREPALAQLTLLRLEYPESVLSESVVQALTETALELGKARRALEELEAYGKVENNPPFLLLRARALEKAGQPEAAVAHYVTLYYRFPLSAEAKTASQRLRALQARLGKKFPAVSFAHQVARAEALYAAERWRDAQRAYAGILYRLGGEEFERGQLRIAQCRVRLGAGPGALAKLDLQAAELDAERLFGLAQAHRSRDQESAMLDAVEQVVARYPRSRWAEEALFLAGNYSWAKLDRARAVDYYRRVHSQYPAGRNALVAHWRDTWLAYLERKPEAAAQLEEHLRRFPRTPYAENALYWLGRSAEYASNLPRARGFYARLVERFPQSYFALRARERQGALGTGPVENAQVVWLIPPAPAAPAFPERIPEAAQERRQRAGVLRLVGLDSYAEQELRAAYAVSGAPQLLIEAAQVALDAGRYAAAVATARSVFQRLEAREFDQAPEPLWRATYPLAYEAAVEKHAARRQLDPMLLLGLIRQESLFHRDAVSRAGALGLMQVMPRTGRYLARREKLSYARSRLLQPDYNIQLGTLYFQDLLKKFGSLEATLAAYNAGDSRVVAWQAERQFAEPAEFVESIPFTETREYVQVVLRNAAIYRRLYGGNR